MENIQFVTKHLNYDGEIAKVPIHDMAGSMGADEMAALLEAFVNHGARGEGTGVQVGEALTRSHRSLQRLVICFCLGVVCGLSKQDRTDPRNDEAIQSAKKIKEMLDRGDLPLGFFL